MLGSLEVLHELAEQLRRQVDTSTASAVQSDHLALSHRLATVEQALGRQLTSLQVSPPAEPIRELLGCLWILSRGDVTSSLGHSNVSR